jgi:hypothetical protein
MRLENRGGDVLARGGSKAQFQGPKVDQKKWDAIFADYVPDSEKKKSDEKETRE